MIYLTLTTLVLYVILGSIIGWFARALYDFEKSEENRRPKPVSAKGTGAITERGAMSHDPMCQKIMPAAHHGDAAFSPADLTITTEGKVV